MSTPNTTAPAVDLPRLVRPLPKDGVTDCPSCGCMKTVKRHNANWTCYKCWFHETVDEDRELEREISNMLMECADWLGRNPQIKADTRAWQHLAVYWPNAEVSHAAPRAASNPETAQRGGVALH